MGTSRLMPLICLLASAAAWSREAASPATCQALALRSPIAEATAALGENAADLRARLKLADVWSDAGCFNEALQVLQQGQALDPHDKELQARLNVAKSVVSEQSYFDRMDHAAKDAALSRAVFRCSKLSELASCDEALSMKPNDAELLMAKGDTLVQLKRPGEALGVYRSALPGSADRDAVKAKMLAAESQRRAYLKNCETTIGDAAKRDCDSAWMPGAPDDVVILKRRGLLLQSDNQLSPALDAYMAAARLQPGDPAVALAIISLSDSTGRKDAVTLVARGAAFMTLNRPFEALEPLRAALRLTPDVPEARAQLKLAERSAAERSANEHRSERAASEQTLASERTGAPERSVASAAGAASGSARTPLTAAVAAGKPEIRRYSNEAPATRSN